MYIHVCPTCVNSSVGIHACGVYIQYTCTCVCVLPVSSPVLDEMHCKEQEDEEGEELNLDPDRESYYKADPKKALKKFFDREGEMG